MAGRGRRTLVKDLVFQPASLTIDYYKDHRLYWAAPKFGRIESILPDGNGRVTVVSDSTKPFRLDVFENWIYWVPEHSSTVYIQDKLGRQPKSVLVRGGGGGGHVQAVRVYHPLKYNTTMVGSKSKPNMLTQP